MRRSDWVRFACRALLPGFAGISIALAAGCSGSGVVTESADGSHPAAKADHAKGAEPAAPQGNPMPLDVYASAVVPRWYVPSQPSERPAFTPHWYTPSVDPLFRHRAPASGPREGAPSQSEEQAGTGSPSGPAQAEPRAAGPRAARPAPAHEDGSLKDFDVIEPLLAGVASWYGPGFHGKRTASGEIYDQHRLTAAHPTLPMGTIIRVENEANGSVVWVRVNDRGPYKKGRVLDLSRAAAERLGMVDEGTAPVRISVLRWPSSTDTDLGLRAYTQYVVQVAAYPEAEKAENALERMQDRFGWATFQLDPRPNGVLSVIAGPYDDAGQAQQAARRLQQSGVTNLVRRYRK
jgi:peptidoglycan lytic transglycosylase